VKPLIYFVFMDIQIVSLMLKIMVGLSKSENIYIYKINKNNKLLVH